MAMDATSVVVVVVVAADNNGVTTDKGATSANADNNNNDNNNNIDPPVDWECRCKMEQWCIQVVDFLQFHHETVNIALTYLDRYWAATVTAGNNNTITSTPTTCTNQQGAAPLLSQRSHYQLACMTALYTAMKLHEPVAVSIQFLSDLARGAYTVHDLTCMELQLLVALEWQGLHPPTCIAFCRQLLLLLLNNNKDSDQKDEETTKMLLHYCQRQADLAQTHPLLYTLPSSTLAYCALHNACCRAMTKKKNNSSISSSFLLNNNDAAARDILQVSACTQEEDLDQWQALLKMALDDKNSLPAAAAEARGDTVNGSSSSITSNNNNNKAAAAVLQQQQPNRRSSRQESPRSVEHAQQQV